MPRQTLTLHWCDSFWVSGEQSWRHPLSSSWSLSATREIARRITLSAPLRQDVMKVFVSVTSLPVTSHTSGNVTEKDPTESCMWFDSTSFVDQEHVFCEPVAAKALYDGG